MLVFYYKCFRLHETLYIATTSPVGEQASARLGEVDQRKEGACIAYTYIRTCGYIHRRRMNSAGRSCILYTPASQRYGAHRYDVREYIGVKANQLQCI